MWRLDGDGKRRELHMSVSTRGRPTGQHVAPRRTMGKTARAAVLVGVELTVSLGVVVLLFVVYEVYVAGPVSAGHQQEAPQAPEDQPTLAQTFPAAEPTQPLADDELLRLYAPALGPSFTRTVREGTDQTPWRPARALRPPPRFRDNRECAIAGHRVTHGHRSIASTQLSRVTR